MNDGELTIEEDQIMRDAIARVSEEDSLVTNYLVIAETIDRDSGEQCCLIMSSPLSTRWGELGLIEFARQVSYTGAGTDE